jgi:CRP-like cAMP-binding protein
VVHRDIKPPNVMVGEFGEVLLMDWGVALVRPQTARGRAATDAPVVAWQPDDADTVVGTTAYMAPEQALGETQRVSARSDVFSIGAVLYEVLTGATPYEGVKGVARLLRAQEGSVTPREPVRGGLVMRALMEVAMRAMQRAPDARYASAADLRKAIEDARRGRGLFATRAYPAGSLIIRMGDQDDDAYMIRAGECRVFRDSASGARTVRILEAGDVFGEGRVLTQAPRNASVEALTDVEVAVVPGAVLREELGADGWMGAFVRSIAHRFAEASRRIDELDGALRQTKIARDTLAVVAAARAPVPLAEVAVAIGADLEELRAAVVLSGALRIATDAGERITLIAWP